MKLFLAQSHKTQFNHMIYNKFLIIICLLALTSCQKIHNVIDATDGRMDNFPVSSSSASKPIQTVSNVPSIQNNYENAIRKCRVNNKLNCKKAEHIKQGITQINDILQPYQAKVISMESTATNAYAFQKNQHIGSKVYFVRMSAATTAVFSTPDYKHSCKINAEKNAFAIEKGQQIIVENVNPEFVMNLTRNTWYFLVLKATQSMQNSLSIFRYINGYSCEKLEKNGCHYIPY